MIKLRTYQRTNQANALGECAVYFIVRDQWISTRVKVHPKFWDANSSSISKKHPNYYIVNPTFQLLKSRAEQCISLYQTSGKMFSRPFFENYIFDRQEDVENPCFLKLMDEYCNVNNLSYGRVQHYLQLKKDIETVKSKPRIADINYSFGLKLQSYLRSKPGSANNPNTIVRKMRQLKAVIHYAQKIRILQHDPLVDIKLKEMSGRKKYLTVDELEVLEKLFAKNRLTSNLQQTLRYFLFSCYTALRYSDIIGLRIEDIRSGFVVTTQEKTEKPVSVPLIDKARDLISLAPGGLCFKTFTNQATNRFLKLIMEVAGIDKKITYHCSRHTFGTLSIFWGIPEEVVAELMGVNRKTVQIYAKIIDQVKVREMQKWTRTAI